jgi:hypothetical protein
MKEALSSSEASFLQEPHGLTSQKTPFFVVTAVKTSNLTSDYYVCRFATEVRASNNLLSLDLIGRRFDSKQTNKLRGP